MRTSVVCDRCSVILQNRTRRRQDDGAFATLDSGQVSADAKTVELFTDVFGSGLTSRAVGFAQAVGMIEELAGYQSRIGEAVGASFGEYVPDGDEELASHGDDGLVLAQARF